MPEWGRNGAVRLGEAELNRVEPGRGGRLGGVGGGKVSGEEVDEWGEVVVRVGE